MQGSCLLLCTQNSDCGEFPEMSPNNPQCQAVVREVGEAEISVCATPGFLETNNSNNNPNSTCTQDAQCRAALGDERAQCSLSGTCIIPAEQHALRITSREMSQALRGPQILGVYLADAQGAPIGYAVEEVYAPQGLGMSTLQLSGEVPEVEAQGLCVPGASGAPAAELGPMGGSLRVHFIDAAGARLLITPEQEIVVVAKSEECGMWSDPSEYELTLCVSPQSETIQEEIHCTQPIGQPQTQSARFNVTAR